MAVSAQVVMAGRGRDSITFGDGVLTGRKTFQKFFDQSELKTYLESQLASDAIPAGIGTFYLFKDDARRQEFLANQFRRREVRPRKRISELRYEENRDVLEPFMDAITALGRLPYEDEYPQAETLQTRFGSLKRAFTLIQRVTGSEAWEAIGRRRREDILVYLALARFHKRPALAHLPTTLRHDSRAFFGSYAKACAAADALLFQAGDASAIDDACKRSPVGKLLPDDLYIHRTCLEQLDPLLRIYEGCGRAYLGEIEGANLIKIHRRTSKISYLVYPDFETDPHPALVRSVRLCLRTLQLVCHDYDPNGNPPILHRKERFLHPTHPLYNKCARLTRQEEKAGLLDETATIGTRAGWMARLQERELLVRGHRVVRALPR